MSDGVRRWVLTAPHAGRYRLLVASAGRGFFCQFDYSAVPDPAVAGLAVAAAEGVGPAVGRWLPYLARGMQAGWEELRAEGRLLCGVRVTLTAVRAHPLDTTEAGCERYAGRFVRELLRERCETAPPPRPDAEPAAAPDPGGG